MTVVNIVSRSWMAAGLIFVSAPLWGYSTGITTYTPPAAAEISGFSGHPSDGQTCSYCHAGGAGAALNCGNDTDLGLFSYTGAISSAAQVVRGGTAPITFTLSKTAGGDIGLGGMGARIDEGSFTGDSTVTIINATTHYTATHNATSNTPTAGTISWSWNWVAPGTPGNYTLYVCGNPTDGDFNCTGDGPHTNTCRSHTFQVINSLPVANNDGTNGANPFLQVSEDSLVANNTGNVLANDTDADLAFGDVLSVASFTTSVPGVVTNNGDGSFGFNPDGDYEFLDEGPNAAQSFATKTIQYFANDGIANSAASATVFIRVNGVNDAPVAVADSFNVNIGGSLSVTSINSILNNDTDADAGEVTKNAILETGPSSASGFSLNTDGTFSYTHNGLNSSNDSFTYKVNDGDADSNIVTVTLNVINTAPIAGAGAATVAEGAQVTIDILNFVTDNETLATASVASVSNAVGGSVQINPLNNQQVIFSHNGAEPSQPASFQYTVSDGFLLSNTATVTLTVEQRNDDPVGNADTIAVNIEGSATALVGGATSVLANDTDAENDALSAELVTGPAFASVFNLGADGTFSYTHNGTNNPSDSFVYRARDNSAETSNPNAASLDVTVTIDITNTQPSAVADAASVNEGQSVDIDVLGNDSDAETSALSISSITNVVNGSTSDGPNGSVTFTHDGSETSVASFQYTISDNFLTSNTATVSISVNPINDSPVAFAEAIAVDIAGTATTIQGSGATSVLANDSDAEGDTLTAVLVDDVKAGSLTLNADGSFSYTHNGSGVLGDSFTYRVQDDSTEPSNPNALSNLVTVNVSVANSAPVANPDAATVAEGQSVNINVLGNDNDAETATLSIGSVTNVLNGTVVIEADNSLTFTHDGSESSSASFSYTASDGFLVSAPAAVSITVDPRNDSPSAQNDVIAVAIAGTASSVQGGALSVLANDSDAENDTLSAQLVAAPAFASAFNLNADGSFSYTHDGSDNLTDSFTYRARDNSAEASNPAALSNLATVSVSIANTAPTAVIDAGSVDEGGSVTVAVLDNDTDAETAATGVTAISNVVNGTALINADNTVSFTHDGSETNTASFDYTANDGFLVSAPATVTLTVNPINDSPVATAEAISLGIAGTATTLVGGESSVLANDSDAENDTLSALLVSPPAFSSAFTLNADGGFSYTHDGSNNLSDSFSYQAQDNSSEATNPAALSNVVEVTISLSNTAPLAIDDAAVVAEGGSITLDVLANDVDNETNIPVITRNLANVTNGAAVINADNSITYTHDGSETSEASFSYVASDGFLDSASSALVTLTVTPTNDPPSIAPLADQLATEGQPIPVLTALGSDIDDANDGVNLVYSLIGAPPGMAISNNADSLGQITWIPPLSGVFNEVHGPITVAVSDGGEDGAVAATTSFSVTVSPPDADGDLLPDYVDLCPAVADASNADFDGDGTPGIDTDANDASGGDVCDNDDDNDGMPDLFELANSFDPFDPTDAAGDRDGDGVSNVDEFNAGTSPLLGALTIDATGYRTEFSLPSPLPASIHPNATAVSANNPGPYRPGRHTITWTASNPGNAFLAVTQQILGVRPLVNLHADQTVVEGDRVSVNLSLNGDAVDYPVEVTYSVSGSAGPQDHTAQAGSVIIDAASNNTGSISFDVLPDTIDDGGETIVLTLNSAINAVIGSRNSTTLTIREGNLPPRVSLQVLQGGTTISKAYVDRGEVTVNALVTDPNAGQSHRYDWSATANALLAPGDTASASWTFTPDVGVFEIDVLVADDASPAGQTRARRLLKIEATAPQLLSSNDSDGDGINDEAEGSGDSDDDGVADYLDSISLPNLLQSEGGRNVEDSLLQGEQGLKLKIGGTAYAAGVPGAAITDETIRQFGGDAGDAPLNASDEFDHIGGVYDFEISGFAAGSSVRLIIPLQSAIPRNARYRKFDPQTGWKDFVEDGVHNRLFSAFGPNGACPEPGSARYVAGLTYLHNCLQILIQDGGPNDPDGIANGVVRDPGAIAVQLSEPTRPVLEQGGAIGLWSLLLMSMLGMYRLVVARKQ